jgi:hypothetical protein
LNGIRCRWVNCCTMQTQDAGGSILDSQTKNRNEETMLPCIHLVELHRATILC